MKVPENPKIFHIVAVDRLASIIQDGQLYSDAIMSKRQNNSGTVIGMEEVKTWRLTVPAGEPPIGMVGECVPFYFCPRSVMLYLLYMGNHPKVSYRGGQRPIIHLVSDVDTAIEWAQENNHAWAFTNMNARASYAEFYFDRQQMNQLRWDLIPLKDFRPPEVKDAKQAEFLVRDSFDWTLVKEIAVYDEDIKRQVELELQNATHKPVVVVRKEWYY